MRGFNRAPLTSTTTPQTTASRQACERLNGLIIACFNDLNAQRSAARIVKGNYQQSRLTDSATRRADYIEELSTLVSHLGGDPETSGSTIEGMRSSMTWLRSLLVGTHYGDAYCTATRLENQAEQCYELASTDSSLSDDARDVVRRQHTQISSDRAEWTLLQM